MPKGIRDSVVSEELFKSALDRKLDRATFKRAVAVFRKFDAGISFEMLSILLHAADKGIAPKVISRFEKHCDDVAARQQKKRHWRGSIIDRLHERDPTALLLVGVSREIGHVLIA